MDRGQNGDGGHDQQRTTPATDEQEEEAVICCEDLSYFARLADAQTFGDLASGEIGRRGVERVGAVAALQDGAEWIPAFVQGQRADAICILDFAHAAQYVSEIGQLAQSAGIDLPPTWFAEQAHALKQEGPAGVLTEVQRLRDLAKSEEISEKVAYLCKRQEQMQYPEYQADGWPIGSGMAESGNKLVVQARLKGAGMHWDRARVNAMLALRTTLSSERWSQDWPVVRADWHTQRLARFRTRQQAALATATRQLQDAFWRLPLSVLLACLPAPAPPPPTHQGRTEGQRRWGRQTFSRRALREGRSAKK